MKDILKTSQRLSKRDVFLVLLPILGLILAHSARPHVIQLSCASSVHVCLPSEVSAFERIAIRPYVGRIDEFSFYAEYAAAFFAIFIPLIFGIVRVRSKYYKSDKQFLSNGYVRELKIYGRDLVICIEAALWNGFLNECMRLWVQRPRPFVYLDAGAGNLAAHYNSFYSGHTSFSAVAMTSMVLILNDRGISQRGMYGAWALAFVVTALTGIFRVFAGRHFPTDVIAGAFFGLTLAFVFRKIVHRTYL